MNTPVREGETIEGSRTMRNRPYQVLKCSSCQIVKNIKLYNLALSDKNGVAELKLPTRSKSIFKNNIEELYKLGAATIHPDNNIKEYKKFSIKDNNDLEAIK